MMPSGEIMILRMGRCPDNKKAGRFPIRAYEGPTKNLLKRRQRNAQQDTMTHWSLLVYFVPFEQKRLFKLGRFSYAFAENTNEMSLGGGFRW